MLACALLLAISHCNRGIYNFSIFLFENLAPVVFCGFRIDGNGSPQPQTLLLHGGVNSLKNRLCFSTVVEKMWETYAINPGVLR